MTDAIQQFDEAAARIDAYARNATDPFLSVKYPVEFGFATDRSRGFDRRFRGYFVRESQGLDLVAVTPETRAEVASIKHGEPPRLDQAARERMLSLPVRADGLILLEDSATVVIKELPLDS